MLMAKLFQKIQTHRQVNFDLTFLVMDPGYNADNRSLIEHNAKSLGIPITIFESSIFDAVDTVEKNPCYLCARMRRRYLYRKAKELGCFVNAMGCLLSMEYSVSSFMVFSPSCALLNPNLASF